MAIVTEEATSSAVPMADPPFELTIDDFARMIEAGIIPRHRRVYLRDGRLFERMAKTRAHCVVGGAVNMAIARRLPDGWGLWPESTIALDRTNGPLPDFAVVRGASPLDYLEGEPRYPAPGDIGLLIEVAVTSLREDLTTQLEKYARAGIPVYWVIDVPHRRVLVHTEPRVEDGSGRYAVVETYAPGQEIPLVLDGRDITRIPVAEVIR
jgi:Uma2 family endonuclease